MAVFWNGRKTVDLVFIQVAIIEGAGSTGSELSICTIPYISPLRRVSTPVCLLGKDQQTYSQLGPEKVSGVKGERSTCKYTFQKVENGHMQFCIQLEWGSITRNQFIQHIIMYQVPVMYHALWWVPEYSGEEEKRPIAGFMKITGIFRENILIVREWNHMKSQFPLKFCLLY